MPTAATASLQEIQRFEADDALHDFGGSHGSKGHDLASYWVIMRLVELERAKEPDYLFVCEYMQDVAEFDSSTHPTAVRLYQLKKKENGYWQANELTGQTDKKKVPKPDKPISKLFKHVRSFKDTAALGAFVSNAKFDVSLASGDSSVNDVRIGLHQLDAPHADAIRKAIADAEGVAPSTVDLSQVELHHAVLAVDDLHRHTSGVVLEFLGEVASEHSGQAASLVETLYSRIRVRARRTDKCSNWQDLVDRRGFGRAQFTDAVESLVTIPDRTMFRTKLLDKLARSWKNRRTVQVTLGLTRCAREKVLVGEANRWRTDSAAIAAICEDAEKTDSSDDVCFERVYMELAARLPDLGSDEISALAIYEMTEWTLNQTRA